MKYEEVYCKGENKTFSLNEVAYLYNNEADRYARSLEGQMFCPDCQKVPMAFVNSKRPHFRGFPNFDHEEGCIFTKEEMTQEEVRDLLTKPAGENEIVHQIDRLVIQFLRNHAGDIAANDIKRPTASGNDPDAPIKKRWQTKSIMPRKQINAPFCDEDYGVAKLFYGRVHIQWEPTKTGDRMKLLVQNIKSKKLICRLFLTPKVYNHLPSQYRTECDAFIVFMTVLNKQSAEKSWLQGSLIKSTLLSIYKINVPTDKKK